MEAAKTFIRQGARQPMPRIQLAKATCHFIMHKTADHSLYILTLDAVGHHLILETHLGCARLWQSYVRDTIDFCGRMVATGYTARQWGARRPVASWTPAMAAAHARWGGGKELSPKELDELLALLLRLQQLADEVAGARRRSMPAHLLAVEAAYEAKVEGLRRSGVTKVEIESSPIAVWAHELRQRIHTVSMSPDASAIFEDAAHTGSPLLVSIPVPLAAQFAAAFAELTGQSVCPPQCYCRA